MSSLDVGWNDILDLAEEKYLMQMTPGSIRWAPACHNRDSKAPPSQFGVNLSQAPSYRSFQGTCHHCGKKGHMKRDCHQLKNSGNSGNSGKTQNNQNGGNRGKGKRKGKNPQFNAPDPNETPARTVNGLPLFEKKINGKAYQ